MCFSQINSFKTCSSTDLGGVQLHTSLNDIDRGQCSVCNGATDTSSSSSFQVVHQVIVLLGRGRGEQNSTSEWLLGGHLDSSLIRCNCSSKINCVWISVLLYLVRQNDFGREAPRIWIFIRVLFFLTAASALVGPKK